ncbi:uncharacterized protein [Euphorbia lathyris]|uniref:uncharacterized protein n=1 Tax=Euphorbia lathyris TaxID=212925 RepID=UPI0033131C24
MEENPYLDMSGSTDDLGTHSKFNEKNDILTMIAERCRRKLCSQTKDIMRLPSEYEIKPFSPSNENQKKMELEFDFEYPPTSVIWWLKDAHKNLCLPEIYQAVHPHQEQQLFIHFFNKPDFSFSFTWMNHNIQGLLLIINIHTCTCHFFSRLINFNLRGEIQLINSICLYMIWRRRFIICCCFKS